MNENSRKIGHLPFLELVKKRSSCRSYRPDPVPRELIERIIEAARLAPSACNSQPWRFAVVTDSEHRTRLVDDGFLPGLGMKWAAGAPALIVLGIHRSLITHKVAPKISGVDYAMVDIGIAGEHAVLQATELGLGTCWVGWINPRAVRRIVEWPRDITPQAVIAVGWPADAGGAPRDRLNTNEISKWM